MRIMYSHYPSHYHGTILMTDLEMMKYLLNKAGAQFTEDVAECKFVRLDPKQNKPPFDIERVDGEFPRLNIDGCYACGTVLFSEQGEILNLEIYS